MIFSKSHHTSLIFVVITMISSACVLPIPTPEHGLKEDMGTITEVDMTSLVAGKTSRDEVLARFGAPSLRLNDGRIFVYTWAVVAGYYLPGEHSLVKPMKKQYLVELEFDEQGTLERGERKAFGRLTTWIGLIGSAKGEAFSVDNLRIPQGKSAIVVYRPKRFVMHSTAYPVSIDGNHLTDLQNGGFALAIVEPGRHAISYPHDFSSYPVEQKTSSVVTEANESVFLEMELQGGLWNLPKIYLHVVPEETAMDEIEKTRRSITIGPSQW